MTTLGILLGPDFEESQFRQPYDALLAKGYAVCVIGAQAGALLRGKHGREYVKTDATARDHLIDRLDALVIPGGGSPEQLRTDAAVVGFVRRFAATGKPIAAVGHGPQLLIEANVVRGKKVTAWPAIRTDLINGGAEWFDRELMEDGPLITARQGDALPAMIKALLERL